MDLHSLPTYQRLAGSNGAAKAEVSGATAAKVYPVLSAMGTLFQNFDCLQDTIARAANLRKNLSGIFPSEQKLREIETLLRGKSVRLPAVAVPMEQRNLLSAMENVEWIAPNELMAAMGNAFKERGIAIHFVDLKQKPMAPGEIKRFVERFGLPGLLDTGSKAFVDGGLRYLKLTDSELLKRIENEPTLLRLPLVRAGGQLSIGQDEASWKAIAG